MSRPSRFAAIASFVLRHRAAAAIGLVLALLGCAAGLARLRIDLSSKAFYGDDDREIATLAQLHARWGHDDATVVVVVDSDDAYGVLTHARLDVMRELADTLRAWPEVVHVDAIPDHPASAAVAKGSRTARAWLHVPPLVPVLLSQDERTAALAVALRFSSDALEPTVEAVDRIDALLRSHDGREGLRLRLAGLPAIRATFAKATVADQRVLVPVALLVVTIVLALGFRRRWQVTTTLALALLPTVMLVGLMGWFGVPIGLLNQGYFTLLPVIALADGVHVVARVAELGRDATTRDARERAVIDGCGQVGLACLLTSVTTAMGFGSLTWSQMPMLRSFGLWAAIGVMLAFAVLLVAAPLLLSTQRDLGGRGVATAIERDALVRATAIARTHPWWVVSAALLVSAVAAWFGSRVPIDNRLSDLVDARTWAAQASRAVDARLGGVLSLELELTCERGCFDQPAKVAELVALERELATLPDVRTVIGPGVIAHASGSSLDGDGEGLRRSWRRLDELGLRAAVLDDAHAIAHVSVRVPDLGGVAFERLAAAVTERARMMSDVEVRVGGTTALAYRGVNRIADELRRSLLLAFVVITVTIALAFRSLRVAWICLVPNAVPLVVGYAAIAGWQGHFDPLGGIILAVALGIAVDDTIHLMARVQQGRRAGIDREAAIRGAIAGSGRACTITSVALVAGLLTFAGSSFPPLRLLGGLGACVIAIAWICDLWLLPAVLQLGGQRD